MIASSLQDQVDELDATQVLSLFSSLPISANTKQGLKQSSFVDMTDIQAKTLPYSLKGHDVLAAARTGSGKTLAFLIPVLEILFRRKWGPHDGLGALIISPTRELAVQIFQVLRSIGRSHSFSAGLVIGGKNLKDERDRLHRMNILVATPGRLLQHLDQTVGFQCENLQLLVLDEADRILDMGFSKTLAALLEHLPKSRQSLLFSATQTRSVADLARLSLTDPVTIGVSSDDTTTVAVPEFLEHHFTVCPLQKKLDILWGFIRTHLKSKILVFFTSCKQVRFVYETFCQMQPGMPLLHLHGKQKQHTRMTVYERFTSTSCATLFATDIAARGLDFPSVEWVVQVDTPEDADTYIHRVGRTARFDKSGKGLLLLVPSERDAMLETLQNKGVEMKEIKIKSSKIPPIQNRLQRILFEDPEMKYLGQRAFISYVRSIHLHKNKHVFQLDQLPLDEFAESLGLPGAPVVKFLNSGRSETGKGKKSAARKTQEEEQKQPSNKEVRTKYDRMFERKNQNILSEHYSKMIDQHGSSSGEESDDDLLTLHRQDHDLPTIEGESFTGTSLPQDSSQRQQRLGKAKRAIKYGARGKKLVFDDEGNPHEIYEVEDHENWTQQRGGDSAVTQEGLTFAAEERARMKQTDVQDKKELKDKKLQKKLKRKQRERDQRPDTSAGVSLAPPQEDSQDESSLPSPKAKRPRTTPHVSDHSRRTIAEDEELALRFLQ